MFDRSNVWKPNIPDKLDRYPMKEVGAKVRGWALIFYHEHFDVNLELPPRYGVENDVENLSRVFEERGLLIKTYKDLKYAHIKQELKTSKHFSDELS